MDNKLLWEDIRKKKRFVIKVGTNSLLKKNGKFDYVSIAKLVEGIKSLIEQGKEVLLVSSGAVSAGMKRLKMNERPNDVVIQQALAAIGNPLLIQQYNQMFDEIPIAQVLLTQHDLSERNNYIHFRNAIEKMLSMGIIPILNENDVISIDELVGTTYNPSSTEYNFSDNDVLSALIVGALECEVLVILSDVDGLYTKHPNSPNAEFVSVVENIDDKIKKMGKSGGKSGRGGMITKILSAEIATKSGAYTVITSAKDTTLGDLFNGNCKSTIFLPNKTLTDKKIWMIYAANARGKLKVDSGAENALKKGASLLLPGITKIDGDFVSKEVVEIINEQDSVIARGVVNYSSKVIDERLTQLKEGTLPKKTFKVISNENMTFLD